MEMYIGQWNMLMDIVMKAKEIGGTMFWVKMDHVHQI
eukprot:CAMPEP_0114660648 /NCGR_PEP_ID=MMETSP0191-20121206/20555_1 /TAXON_ID=126664 /ORGANISM="Sorites sp." /LENGTH=36 /DNA_ID= /DNA_START= /DNA_END= /DNA_ORIENTATION=